MLVFFLAQSTELKSILSVLEKKKNSKELSLWLVWIVFGEEEDIH